MSGHKLGTGIKNPPKGQVDSGIHMGFGFGEIYELFLDYLEKGGFVRADMSQKDLQMGYTRARRYANYKGGKKYDKDKDY
ncbi:hypothetical protein GCM10022289_19120 [Pedobacter jeongneungensis]|uniref:Uncharacterized protein n=1 Tax=Pedobacter jeongneungensis TaxID=947309 RepID=A0ABP8BC37_9SPHI